MRQSIDLIELEQNMRFSTNFRSDFVEKRVLMSVLKHRVFHPMQLKIYRLSPGA